MVGIVNVLLECIHSSQSSKWKYKDKNLYVGWNAVQNIFGEIVRLLGNYSLYIERAPLIHEGTFECVVNSSTTYIYCLHVQAEIPLMREQMHHGMQDPTLMVTCY
ncbi:hypothetical protein HOLleu_25338 [Holothuria leucospilota]|uniref:Uncharacterized protein n=1 Tax=Holothuria leucospilota TaxID=206669 RepID=A0A9Q1BSI2_HOLLE|nr:hypothetical protein HOLleu_25338 [Holothuria leucospilota]